MGINPIQDATTVQQLIFSLKIPYTDIQPSFTVSNLNTITNNAGLRVLMNPKFRFNSSYTAAFYPALTGSELGTISLTMATNTTDANASYTLATFSASTSDGMQKISVADANPTDHAFAFDGIQINKTSGIYVDENLYDFYLVAYNGINGAVNQ